MSIRKVWTPQEYIGHQMEDKWADHDGDLMVIGTRMKKREAAAAVAFMLASNGRVLEPLFGHCESRGSHDYVRALDFATGKSDEPNQVTASVTEDGSLEYEGAIYKRVAAV